MNLVGNFNNLAIKYNQLLATNSSNEGLHEENQTQKIQMENLKDELQRVKETYSTEIREFKTIAEFREFSRSNKIDEIDYVPIKMDCDDFAIQTQKAASIWRGGRFMNCQYQVSPDRKTAHMLNTVVIQGVLYMFEPQTDRLWKHVSLD